MSHKDSGSRSLGHEAPHLLVIGGGVLLPSRQMKVYDSEVVSVEEFLDDIFKLKKKFSYVLL